MTKGEIMKKLNMDYNVDSAVPQPFVQDVHDKTGIPMWNITGNFVMDYRNGTLGTFTPITPTGILILHVINKVMNLDLPFPSQVYNVANQEVERVWKL